MNAKKLLVLLMLAFSFWSVVPMAFGQDAAGGSSAKNDSNPGTASDIREDFYKRMKNAKSFSPRKFGGEDVVVDEESIGPGKVKHNLTGPVQVWPVPIKEAVSIVPTLRDQGIQRNPLVTFGMPISDTQYQILHRYDQNIMLEQLFDPEKVIWVINAMGMIQTQSAANSAANLARNQSSAAIEYAEKYLPNFTTQAGNRWNTIRDKLFVPMAILLLLPGAVLAQVKAIIAQGSPLFGDVNPFDGILRSIIAIFFIPATYLVVNYGIDVSNSMALTIRENYQRIFHSNMYKDAECAEKRAFGIRPKDSNDNGIFRKSKPSGQGAGDLQAWSDHERNSYDIYGPDPCAGGGQVNDLADETTPVLMNVSRVAVNVANVGLAGTWNVMCAFQIAYLHYLFLIGPIVAALWVWPIDAFRKALGSWVEGVLIICFWALFWNTTILLMACFRNVCVTGTVIMTALNVLAIYSVQHAFNFLGLVQAASREAAAAGQEAGSQAAGGAMAHGAKSGAAAQGAAITQAAQAGAAGSASAAAGNVGGGPGAAGQAAGGHGGAPLISGGGQAGGGVGTGSAGGSGSGHGGSGGTSPFQSGAASPAGGAQAGVGPHVAPPPGSAQGGGSQFSPGIGGTPSGHGSTAGAPPSFGGASQGPGGSGGNSGAAGGLGHGGATGGSGTAGGLGSQQPGIAGGSGSLSNSQSNQAHTTAGHGQAAGMNAPPGSSMSSDVHSQAGGAHGGAGTAQGGGANLGLNLHEGAGGGISQGIPGQGGLDLNIGANIMQPPLESGFAGGSGQFLADASAAMAAGFPPSTDVVYNPPPVNVDSPSVFTQEQQIVTTQEVQTTTQNETQTVVNQETQTMVPQEIQTQVVQEAQPQFTQDQSQQVFEQSPQYVASSDLPPLSGAAQQDQQERIVTETSYVTQTENVASQQPAADVGSSQSGAVPSTGLQSSVQASGPVTVSGLTNEQAQKLASANQNTAGSSSVIDRILKGSTQGPQTAQFTGPVSYGGDLGEEGLLSNAGLPPASSVPEGSQGEKAHSNPEEEDQEST